MKLKDLLIESSDSFNLTLYDDKKKNSEELAITMVNKYKSVKGNKGFGFELDKYIKNAKSFYSKNRRSFTPKAWDQAIMTLDKAGFKSR